MAVNKNFVIKNGLEVSENLILADATTNKVGVGTSTPSYILHVFGGIGATDLVVTGVTTINNELNVGTGGSIFRVIATPGVGQSVGIGTAVPGYLLDVRSLTGSGQTALYVEGGVFIDGSLNLGGGAAVPDIIADDITVNNQLTILNFISSGIGTLQDLKIDGILYDSTNSNGTVGQYLKSTATGVEWESFGVYRNQQTFISTEGQTVYDFIHQPNELDVYLNGVKLVPTTEYVGVGTTVTLVTPAFAGDILEMISLVNSNDLVLIDGATITVQDNGTNVGLGSVFNFGTGLVVSGGGAGTIGVVTITAGVSTTFDVTSSSSSDVVFPTFASGIGSETISVNESNLTFIPSSGKLGIGTTLPQRNLEVNGDIAFNNQLHATTLQRFVLSGVGTLDAANRDFIGVNTSGLQVGYLVEETDGENEIPINTLITSIGIGSVAISNLHRILVGSATTNLSFYIPTQVSAGFTNQVLVSRGSNLPSIWANASDFVDVTVTETSDDQIFYGVFSPVNSGITTLSVNAEGLAFNPSTNSLGIGTSSPSTELEVVGDVTAIEYFGSGINLSGIVTQITAGIGVSLTPPSGSGSVQINAYKPIGKTIFVSQTGDDLNTGLSENHPKRTIKAAAAVAFPGDTIKVYPGVYVENNPIQLSTRVSVEGTELRNCVVTPRYLDRDLFHVNNSCHITDLSFVSQSEMTNGAAIIALQPLLGVSTDRFFDAARMIRYNLDYIAKESVGFLTSTQYIGAGRTQESDPVFEVVDSGGSPISPGNCSDDIKDILKSIIHDITRGGNSKCVGAGKSYYNADGTLLHIIGTDTNGYSVQEATIDTIQYAAGIARAIINNVTWGSNPVGVGTAVVNAVYDNTTGLATITATNHGLSKDDAVKVIGLGFTCPSGPGIVTYPSGNLGYIFNVNSVVGVNTFEVVVGQSTLPHTYVSGGTIQKYENFQNDFTQVKDLGMQPDPDTGYNNTINSCSDVVSAIYSCVGVVTSIINNGLSILGAGINTSFPANSGTGTTSVIGITTASYDNELGSTILVAPNFSVRQGDIVEVRDLLFECSSGGTMGTQAFPSGRYGYLFDVTGVSTTNNSFTINTGVSTLPHTYVGGGYVVNRAIGVTTASYDNTTGITTITAPGAIVKVGQLVTLHDLEFSCTSGAGTTTLYPTGNLGYEFRVTEVIGVGNTFVVNTGVSTIPHTYEGGGVIFPPYSPGVDPITQGPYIRNCTNFVPGSIGMKVDGFEAEPGDRDDIGVTGTMSVDSYTQYNQGGIGVSITNGAYSQLVSIFTICDDIAIFTGSGGQCDITNSNSSFGRLGLVADGVGDYNTKSIYRYSGVATTDIIRGNNVIPISGVGTNRPYDGQVCYFGDLYYFVNEASVINGGSGYNVAPKVTFSTPEGENGITAQASSEIDSFGRVTAISIVNSGTQYLNPPTITIDPPAGVGVTATAAVSVMQPIYYKVDGATLPSAGISTVTFLQTLNNTVSAGTTVYFSRVSLQITSSHSFEWVGSGNNINTAKPALGGVVIPENEVVQSNGGIVVYTSTDQAGNFKIGDGVVINQATGQISGRDFTKALFTTMTPFILALAE